MTSASAAPGGVRSGGGERSAALSSQSATTGVASSHETTSEAASSSHPARRTRAVTPERASQAPAPATSSGPPGGRSTVCNSVFSMTSMRGGAGACASESYFLPGAGAPAQEQRAAEHHDVDEHRHPPPDGSPAELRQETHPALPGGKREEIGRASCRERVES